MIPGLQRWWAKQLGDYQNYTEIFEISWRYLALLNENAS
jgi:hypothetical protein